jgi:hypothetical protein
MASIGSMATLGKSSMAGRDVEQGPAQQRPSVSVRPREPTAATGCAKGCTSLLEQLLFSSRGALSLLRS